MKVKCMRCWDVLCDKYMENGYARCACGDVYLFKDAEGNVVVAYRAGGMYKVLEEKNDSNEA